MRIMKYLQLTFLVLLFCSCSNVKSIYDTELTVDKNHRRSNYIIDKFEIKSDNSIIYFTNGFKDDNLEVINGKDKIYNRNLNTIEQISQAGSCIIKNNIETSIIVNSQNKIILNNKKLKLYKFIYLEKQGEKYIITYTNKARSFM